MAIPRLVRKLVFLVLPDNSGVIAEVFFSQVATSGTVFVRSGGAMPVASGVELP